MKALVTGNKGFIGSNLFKRIEAIGIDRKGGNDILTMKDFPEADVVFHLAAQTDVGESIRDPQKDAQDNVLATIILLKRYRNAKFIYVSTAGAIDNGIKSPYGLSKHTAENYVKLLHDNYRICRLPNVYGGGNGVVDIFQNSDRCVIYGDGSKTRNFVHVDDIVDGILESVNWNVGSYTFAGETYSILEIAKMTKKPIIFEKERPGEVEHSTIKNTAPWKPTIKLKDFYEAQHRRRTTKD